jgi:hypothetical protein
MAYCLPIREFESISAHIGSIDQNLDWHGGRLLASKKTLSAAPSNQDR